MRFLISAGEASGELYGALLIEALRHRQPDAEFFGVGGERMRAAGCDTVVDAARLSVVGISEIVSHLPRIYGDFRRLTRAAEERKPDAAIVIDSPAFNFRVAREMHSRGVPVIYYVCPQLWAWRERRVQRFHKWVKKALVIFPFEEQWYRERGVDAEYVGHPLADEPRTGAGREQYASQHRLDPSRVWIGLLPGSRKKEVVMNLPTLLETCVGLRDRGQFLLPVASTLDRAWVESLIPRPTPVHLVEQASAALPHLRAAAVASGTATVEAALAGTPMVVVYRVAPVTWKLGRGLLRVPFIAMPNLIAGREVVPELLQSDFTAAAVATKLAQILPDGPAREKMLAGLAEVSSRLRSPGASGTASERAADAVLRTLA
ncbi:MAG: lipid-A-disaccharide synthase [Acidobacteria bacterium]|nr:lipid-A-disaccharide synthase [Acidobacteriota bacterium]